MSQQDTSHDQINTSVGLPQEIITADSSALDESKLFGHVTHNIVDVSRAGRIALVSDPRGPQADRFRFLRMRLRDLRRQAPLRSLVITSAVPQDGKSTVALNLATALAEGQKESVLLIEADLHCPTLAQSLDLPVVPGLAEYLEGHSDPALTLWHLHPMHLHLLQAGTAKSNPTALLQTAAFSNLLDAMCSHFDWVLIDTPPVAPLTDALLLSRQVDACLLVIREGHTPREAVEQALSSLGPSRVAGLIFNGADDHSHLYSKYSQYYGRK